MFVQAILAICAGILIWAAISDALRLRIPNNVPLALLALFPVYFFLSHGDPIEGLKAVGLALAIFAIGFVFFARGWMGGGDVKLMSVGALWAGPALLPDFLAVTAVIGGLQALASLLPLYKFLPHWMTLAFAIPGGPAPDQASAAPTASAGGKAGLAARLFKRRRQRNLPYGIAIAAGGLYVTARLAGVIVLQ
jgi:prepilin peptidase CpaA